MHRQQCRDIPVTTIKGIHLAVKTRALMCINSEPSSSEIDESDL
jgi:hypothetical protein